MLATFELGFSYLLWHYSSGFRDLFAVWGNLVWFLYNFFALPQHVRSLIAPFRRLDEKRHGFGLTPLFETLIINTLMRGVGFLFRLVTIIAGVLSLLGLFFVGCLALIFWCLAPLLLLGLFLISFKLLLP